MDVLLITLIIIAAVILFLSLLFNQKSKLSVIVPMPEADKQLLTQHVIFYQQLGDSKKREFENRVQQFLGQVKITGVKTVVEDIDKILVAASAIIPIFNFPGWEYVQLNEVLLYPDNFNHDFEQEGNNRSVLGMVGNGAMNGVMILSQHELRQDFINKTGKDNVAIHEFVHLVDKTDGAIDGVPAFIMEQHYIQPWLQLMHQKIKLMKEEKSDIDIYGATNEAEFFAVVSEYFFERPKLLKDKHPDLYTLLEKIFKRTE